MRGLMMDRPLMIGALIQYAAEYHGDAEIVSRTVEGPIHRYTYVDAERRAKQLAKALKRLGVGFGDRVATIGWNGFRHFELYFAISGIGAVCHTINPRLFADHLGYIVNHAEDKVIFLDASLAERMPRFEGVEREVLMPDADARRDGALDYEELVASGDPSFEFPDLDENAAAAMCYTSGTTGLPKGVVYSHRSTVLHSLLANQADAIGLRERDTVLPIVPMFHANAWGLPYAATLAGSKLVLPGPKMDPADLARLIGEERVTMSGAVPTIWQGMAQLEPRPDLSSLDRVVCGGSAVPESLTRTFDQRFGVPIIQAWGMTETSPLASICRVPPGGPEGEDAYAMRALQGRVVPLVEFRVDEEVGGELQVRGPTIARSYYNDQSGAAKFTDDGWLRTGDVAEIQEPAFIKLVDRTKDLVKSGGEWISSVELENAIMAHPDVREAAVIAMKDERWGERPCACVVVREGSDLDPDALREFLADRVAKWWLPDRVAFIDEVPKTSVGKFDKKVLRAQLADGTLGHR